MEVTSLLVGPSVAWSNVNRRLGLYYLLDGSMKVNVGLLCLDRYYEAVPDGIVVTLMLDQSFPPAQGGIDAEHAAAC